MLSPLPTQELNLYGSPPFLQGRGGCFQYSTPSKMEITLLGHLFWFSIVCLILSQIKQSNRSFIINFATAGGFFIYGLGLLVSVTYIGWDATGVDVYTPDPVPNNFTYQITVGVMFALFGFVYAIFSVFRFFTGEHEDKWPTAKVLDREHKYNPKDDTPGGG